jgi:SH3-like domain-containing protein
MSASHPFSWHDLLRYGHVWGYLLKWPIYFVAGWVAILFRRWRKSRDENMAQGWPSVEGVIVSGKVSPIHKPFPCRAAVHLFCRRVPHRRVPA